MNTNTNTASAEMDMTHLNLICVTTRLSYAPRDGEVLSNTIFDVKEQLQLAVPGLSCATSDLIKANLKGVLAIKNNINKKTIYSNGSYAIVKPTEEGFIGHKYKPKDLADVIQVLNEGWKISALVKDHTYNTIFTKADIPDLVEMHDYGNAWRELVAACLNIDIERTCDWSTNGAFRDNLVSLFKNPDDKPEGDEELIDSRLPEDWVVAFIDKRLDTLFNDVFKFTRANPEAFYHASVNPRGIVVSRYTDVRAFAWHYETAEKERLQELAREEGLSN